MSLCGNDSISPYSTLKVVFSSPLQDSQHITFHFTPQFYDYSSIIASSRDTIRIIPSSPFKGNTSYKLFLENPLNSDGSSDTLSFHTYFHEREPNNNIETADSIYGKIYGTISVVSDTDLYSITVGKSSGLYMISQTSQSVFSISDNSGNSTPVRKYKSPDSIMIPDSFNYPIYVRVYSYYRSCGGNYEIGLFTN